MTSLFEDELLEMEREVRDLKTIHDRGIGTTRFYSYEQDITIPSGYYNWYLEATVENTNLNPMAILPFIGGENTVRNFTLTFTSNGFVVSSLASEGTVDIRILTSSALSNIETRIEPW